MPHKRRFDYTSGASFTVATVPAGGVVGRIGVLVKTAFNGAAPTLEVGDAADDDRFIITTDVDLKTPGITWLDGGHDYAAQTAVLAALDIDGSTAGEAIILMEQW